MVLRLLEGFQTKRVLTTKFDRLFTSIAGTVNAVVTGRKAGVGLASVNLVMTSKQLVDPDENTWIVGFAFRKPLATTLGANSTIGIQLQNASGEQCSLVIKTAGLGGYKLELKRDSVVIDTTSGAFPFGSLKTWTYFQLKVAVRTGTNGSYELRSYDRLNNMTVEFSGSSVNLAHQTVDGADRLRISWQPDSGSAVELDDIIAMDGSGAVNNDFMAQPAVILGALPDADGNQSDWTPSAGSDHYLLVDDSASSQTDTDKVTAQVIGDTDLYTYSDFASIHTSGTVVIGTQVISTAAMDASGSRTLRVVVRENSLEAVGANFTVSDLVVRSFRQMFDLNPTDTPETWTKATLEATEFGLEIQA